ncbi:MAG: hypothetical protein K8I30_11235, partial [Anaerolineae bacterium]|nr:hypothetical protein [Anaerolineae bacterium]
VNASASAQITVYVSSSFNAESTDIINVTSSHADGAFKAGEVIGIEVVYSADVLVTGTPQLTLETGSTDRVVDYTGGSGSDTLVFNYTVQPGDVSSGLDYTATTALSFNGGTIRDGTTNSVDAEILLPAPGAAGSLGANTNIVIDTQAPTVVVSTTASDPTSTSPIPVGVDFSEPVLGFVSTDVSVTNGTISDFSGGPAVYSFDVTPDGQGTVMVSIPAACATDIAGNNNTGDSLSRVYSVVPGVTIGAPSLTHANGDDVSYTITYTGASSITLDAGDVTVHATGTAAQSGVTVMGAGATERTVTLPGTSGDGTLGISLAPGTAENGLGTQAPAAGPSTTFVVDTTAPAIVVSEPNRWFVRTGHQLTFDLYFLEANAISLSSGQVALHATGTAAGDLYSTGTGTQQRKIRILNLTGNGTLAFGLAAGVGADSAGNMTPPLTTGPVVVVDNTPPAVYVSAPSISSATTGPASFDALISGAYGVLLDAADVTLNATGTANGNAEISGAGRYQRKIKLSAMTGDGSLGVSLLPGTAYDRANNFAVAAGPSPTLHVDNSPPFDDGSPVPQIIISAPTRWYTGGSKIVKLTVAYTDAELITLTSNDLVFNTTGTAVADVTVTGTGRYFRNINLYNIAGDGSISFNILGGTASNANGAAPPAGPGPVIEVDNTAPGIYISPPSELRTNAGPVAYTILFSDAYYVTLDAADVSLVPTGTANGTISVSGAGRYKRKVRISDITGNGALSIDLGAGTSTDWAGNPAPVVSADVAVKVAN